MLHSYSDPFTKPRFQSAQERMRELRRAIATLETQASRLHDRAYRMEDTASRLYVELEELEISETEEEWY